MSLIDDINNLDMENMGGWPFPIKIGAVVLLCLIIIAAGWHFDWKDQWAQLEKAERDEETKLTDIKSKQQQAANLDALKAQLKEIEENFGDMLRQLPDKTEIAGLLVDISQTGLGAGLEFELFKPQPEKPVEFYYEKPIEIRVVGNYHEFGEFVSSVAALPRIVTMHDIEITQEKENENLLMVSTAKTYRALDEDDEGDGEEVE